MKLEQQVCTLEQAKKLKELGIVPKSVLFLWLDYSKNSHGPKIVNADVMDFESDRSYIYAAFTVAELGVMLPDYITGEHLYTYQQRRGALDKRKVKHDIYYWCMGNIFLHTVTGEIEAEARAAMLIYLLENKLITPEEVNNRLNP